MKIILELHLGSGPRRTTQYLVIRVFQKGTGTRHSARGQPRRAVHGLGDLVEDDTEALPRSAMATVFGIGLSGGRGAGLRGFDLHLPAAYSKMATPAPEFPPSAISAWFDRCGCTVGTEKLRRPIGGDGR
jgi:hypothetical protein